MTAPTGGMRVFTITSAQLKACPETIILPGHYRKDGTCLHELREREPVVYRSDVLDDGPREFYSGSKAVIVEAAAPDEDDGRIRYLIEFESGNRMTVSLTEVHPDD